MNNGGEHSAAIGGSLFGTALGLAVAAVDAVTRLPLEVRWSLQVVVTIMGAVLSAIAVHFTQRWLNKRWPKSRRRGDTDS